MEKLSSSLAVTHERSIFSMMYFHFSIPSLGALASSWQNPMRNADQLLSLPRPDVREAEGQ